jgi:hypothetical protein
MSYPRGIIVTTKGNDMNAFTVIAYPPNANKVGVDVTCSFGIEAEDKDAAINIFDKTYRDLFGEEGLILDIFDEGTMT